MIIATTHWSSRLRIVNRKTSRTKSLHAVDPADEHGDEPGGENGGENGGTHVVTPASELAVIRAIYPAARGALTLRGGSAGLDWFTDRAPDVVDGEVSTFCVPVAPGEIVAVKLVRGDGAWMMGRNVVVARGDSIELRPSFERDCGDLSGVRSLDAGDGRQLAFRVRLPPSYSEQDTLRYPVLYAQDGQSVWSDGSDPYGTWGLDPVLDCLWDLGGLDEFIVVTLDTAEDRLNRLSPVADPHHGGGGAPLHLDTLVNHLKPLIDTEFRTRSDRASTVLLGASMGGLFSLWAALTRPEIFGGAICLSPSLWWADRFMQRFVSGGTCPLPRPNIYLDSGAASSGFEPDASTRDGVHNTRAMYRALREHCCEIDDDLYLFSWPGHEHDGRSWAARIAIPLQLFFPRRR